MNTAEEVYHVFLTQMGEENFLYSYREACQNICQKLEQINIEQSQKLGRTFISQITHRIKSPESCLNKMLKKSYTVERQMAREKLNDIAGVRVVCNFLDDIYHLAGILEEDEEIEVIKTKDYVKKPKASGYQSLHVIVLVPVSGAGKQKVEIQIRTQAMNFWAVVEHHFVYKKGAYGKNEFEKDLKECARAIYKIDQKMLLIRERMEMAQK